MGCISANHAPHSSRIAGSRLRIAKEFALPPRVFRGCASCSNLRLGGLPGSLRRCSQGGAVLAEEFFSRLYSSAALRRLSRKRSAALGVELASFSIVSSALRAAHRLYVGR